MTKEEINQFTKRIAQSNKTELVVISYEIIINYLDASVVCLEEKDYEKYVHNLHKAQQFLNDLISSLDYKYELSYDLLSLYGYANRKIAKSIIERQNCDLGVVRNIMDKLRESFDGISGFDKSGAAMANSGTVYAGITYGKGIVNETIPPGSTYN